MVEERGQQQKSLKLLQKVPQMQQKKSLVESLTGRLVVADAPLMRRSRRQSSKGDLVRALHPYCWKHQERSVVNAFLELRVQMLQ